MLKKIVQKYIAFITRYYLPLLLLIGIVTWYSFPSAMHLFRQIQTDFKLLLPEDYESVKLFEEMQSHFGSLKSIQLIIETQDPQKLKETLPKFAAFVETHPEVKEVEYRKRGYEFFDQHKLFYPSYEDLEDFQDRLDRRIQREKLGGLFFSLEEEKPDDCEDLKGKYTTIGGGKLTSPYFTDKNETVFALGITPKSEAYDVGFFKRFTFEIKNKISAFDFARHDPTAKISYMGGVIGNVVEYDALMRDLRVAGTISGIAILLLIAFYFRGFRSLIFLSVPLACGILWNFAIAAKTVGHLNIITSFLFSILFGLGIDFGIHLNSRYNEERHQGKNVTEALLPMLLYTGRSCFTACTTTAVAFAVLMINDFKGFSEFGNIAGIGIMVAFLASLLVLPLLLILEEKIPFLRRKNFHVASWKLTALTRLSDPFLFRVTIVATLLLGASALFLRFHYDFSTLSAQNEELLQTKQLYWKINPHKASPSVVLVHSKEEALAVEKAVNQMAEKETSLVFHARSLYSLVPNDQRKKIPLLRSIHRLLDNDLLEKTIGDDKREEYAGLKASALATPFTLQDIPKSIQEVFLDKKTEEQNQLVYIFIDPEIDLKDGEKAIALREEIWNIHTDEGKTFHAISSSIIFADVLRVMIHDAPVAIILSLITIVLLLFLDFQNIKKCFVTLLPLFVGVVWMLGLMVLLKEHLNFFNTIALPVVLGIGIDNGVHLFHRFQEEGYRNFHRVLTTTGSSIVMTSLTTALGFSGLIFAHHGGLNSLGVVATVGVLCCLFAALISLAPILAKLWKD